ncbi:unnamed protein product [Cylindrotheca closterium]|uniref:Uncharacterized protein n=1 Tax=Cylindrotheca closterium TaxID=2856 RepID=A0AAD2JI38_9STRA|nr:unnamed protein product [Cylindrotheca closterium]
MDFMVIAAPAIAAMQERSDILGGRPEDRKARVHSLHPLQEKLMQNLFSVDCKLGIETKQEIPHPYPLQQKLMRKIFSATATETGSEIPQVVITDPRPLRQQPEPRVKISLRRRITESATYTWQLEMTEESPFVFEEVL